MASYVKNIILPKNRRYVLSISFAKYVNEKSGMAKVHMAQQKMFNDHNISYIHIFVLKKMIMHDSHSLFCDYGMYIDGKYIGIYSIGQLINIIIGWKNNKRILLDIHIHHLMYIRLSQMKELFDCLPNTRVKFYIHDYYLMCYQYNLINSEGFYCGNHGLNEKDCKSCKYYKYGIKRMRDISDLLDRYLNRITFISPSDSAKNIFLGCYPDYRNNVIVIPHQKQNNYYKENIETICSDEPIRVAFLGYPAIHKGWNQFLNCIKIADNNKYEFYIFNSSDDVYENVKKVKIGYTSENMNAMTDALREKKIHMVLLWSLCQETYSYTCFEAFSANCFLISNSISGNIPYIIRNNENGLVLYDENELYKFFKNPNILRDIINQFRKSKKYGPYEMIDNNEIVTKSNIDYQFEVYKPRINFSNLLLLKTLDYLYRKKRI